MHKQIIVILGILLAVNTLAAGSPAVYDLYCWKSSGKLKFALLSTTSSMPNASIFEDWAWAHTSEQSLLQKIAAIPKGSDIVIIPPSKKFAAIPKETFEAIKTQCHLNEIKLHH